MNRKMFSELIETLNPFDGRTLEEHRLHLTILIRFRWSKGTALPDEFCISQAVTVLAPAIETFPAAPIWGADISANTG